MGTGLLVLALLSGRALAALTLGSRGASVTAVQGYLVSLGLLAGRPDGVYGPRTREAVRSFQRQQGLVADGVVGPSTLDRLRQAAGGRTVVHRVSRGDTVYGIARRYGTSADRVIALNGLTRPEFLRPGQTLMVPARGEALPEGSARLPEAPVTPGSVELLSWPEVNRLFPRGTEAKVIDVGTGRTFRVRRIQGTNHADSEPLDFADTEVMRAAYGGRWSWDRRAVVVEVAGRRIAASMNGYPHGTGHYQRNGFKGHFCLHFLGSRTHGSRVVDPAHQAAVQAAFRWGESRPTGGEDGGRAPEEPRVAGVSEPED